jgi:2,4'-dihydroxyacetophenone dioxygenase
MSAEPITTAIGTAYPDGSTVVRGNDIPWTPWAGPGTWYKLFYIDPDTGFMSFLLKVDANTPGGNHKHYGAAMGYVLEGKWGYSDREFRSGDFFKEGGAVTHAPVTGDEGTIMVAYGFGPIAFFDEEGTQLGVVDAHWMYETARANGAADHIQLARPLA